VKDCDNKKKDGDFNPLDEFEDDRIRRNKRLKKSIIDDEEVAKPKKRGRKPKVDGAASGTEGGKTPKKKKRTKK